MIKSAKRKLSVFLAVAMMFTLVIPMTVFAAEFDVTADINGVAVSGVEVGVADTTLISAIKAASTTVKLTATEAAENNLEPVLYIEDDGGVAQEETATWYKLTSGEDSGLTDGDDIDTADIDSVGTEYTSADLGLVDGDVLWAVDSGSNWYRFEIEIYEDLTSIAIKGVNAPVDGGSRDFASVTGKTLSLVQEEADDAVLTPAVVFDTDGSTTNTLTWYLFNGTTTPNASAVTAADLTAGANDYTDEALAAGDVLWAVDETGIMYKFIIAITALNDATSDGTITGNSTTETAIIKVTLPANLNFALDPFELTGGGSQIVSTDYVIANKSNAPVQVTFNITATAAGVSFVKESAIKKNDITATTKDMYFTAVGATAVTGTPTFINPKAGTYTYAKTAGTIAQFVPGATDKATTSISFALAAGRALGGDDTIDNLALNNKGVASFKFDGSMNTYAAWTSGAISVSGAYSFKTLNAGTYTAINTVEDLNMIPVVADPENDVKFSETGSKTAATAEGTSIVIYLSKKPASITSIIWEDNSNYSMTSGDDYSYVPSTGILTLLYTPSQEDMTSGKYVITIPGGDVYTLTWEEGPQS